MVDDESSDDTLVYLIDNLDVTINFMFDETEQILLCLLVDFHYRRYRHNGDVFVSVVHIAVDDDDIGKYPGMVFLEYQVDECQCLVGNDSLKNPLYDIFLSRFRDERL